MVQLKISAGTPASLGPGLMEALARYRHRIFVERLGWRLTTRQGLELDQFDRDDTLHVVACGPGGDVVGSARLLPTDRPYLLRDVFPQLMQDTPLPRGRDVWELSRFAATGGEAEREKQHPQFASPLAIVLLASALRVAAGHGVRRLITVSPLGIERLLRREGFAATRAGSPRVVDGHPIFACWIEATEVAWLHPPDLMPAHGRMPCRTDEPRRIVEHRLDR